MPLLCGERNSGDSYMYFVMALLLSVKKLCIYLDTAEPGKLRHVTRFIVMNAFRTNGCLEGRETVISQKHDNYL